MPSPNSQASTDPPKKPDLPAHRGHGHRQQGRGENRLPPALAVVVAIGLYALLPQSLLLGPRLLLPALEVVLLLALVITHPHRLDEESRLSRIISLALTAIIILTNLTALGLLVDHLTQHNAKGGSLLVAGLQVWATNVIAFGLLFWNIDRGGPVARSKLPRDKLPLADFRFSHDEDHDAVVEVAAGSSRSADWAPTFVDYLYVSTTNSSAFSPTDTMPLSSRAKMLMALEATSALLVSLLVIARAVGSFT
ncbi:hypothetical protein SAMN05892883_4420 [Jatrophihabitans sp. GAS493]|uniref:hypothetical protein n=1 Tax=Jatrophihabitans sp. GAS493 TaxID=1907575 RepID=UPI000BBFB0F1|nr:hypothetical protein [Jatrophihabitans sp. GAS493]SOD70278.1 hypothetical protein SAMN05892883_0009 [Jatrophihabitans sp. GAS493]SOD75213.1 hypothetical protein SAMN05892883_4420 [Jatrophihabitans sp. GAS493]